MDKAELYKKTLDELASGLHLLDDKPDETPISTLGALWLTAFGRPSSATEIPSDKLPELSPAQKETLVSFVKRRVDGEPLAHITERQLFLGIELLAGPGALIPRKETEILAKAALAQIEKLLDNTETPLVIDVCTGAGNLPIAYAKTFKQAKVFASDLSEEAVELAKRNAQLHKLEDRVQIFAGDLLEPFNDERFLNKVDLITCNPPYISSAKVEDMACEISDFEPKLAFDGGPFGVKILKRLVNDAPNYLNKQGCLMFEVGLGQGDAVTKLIQRTNKFSGISPTYDENEQIRAIKAYI